MRTLGRDIRTANPLGKIRELVPTRRLEEKLRGIDVTERLQVVVVLTLWEPIALESMT